MTAADLLDQTEVDLDQLLALLHPITPRQVKIRSAPPVLQRLWGREIVGMTLGKTIFVDPDLLTGPERPTTSFLVHELVHSKQWTELGVLRFLRSYLGDYLWARRHGLDHRAAYLSVRLEVEARESARRYG